MLVVTCPISRFTRHFSKSFPQGYDINPLNAELSPICHLLALLGAHHILHVGRISVKIGSGSVKRHAVAQLVETVRYKLEDRGFDSRWCHWNFPLT